MIALLVGRLPRRRVPRRELAQLVDELGARVAELEAEQASDAERVLALVAPFLRRAADGFAADAAYLERPPHLWAQPRPADQGGGWGSNQSRQPKDWQQRAQVARRMAVELRAFADAQVGAVARIMKPHAPALREQALGVTTAAGRVDAVVGA